MGGFGSAVLESLSDQGIQVPIRVLGLPDWYIEQGPQDLLREKYGLTADGIYEQAKELMAQVSRRTVEKREPASLRGFSVNVSGAGRDATGDEQGS
jgi:1-deoxy-D-xylulose-5-phosphate synthase